MSSENKIDWLSGPISNSFSLADIQIVRGVFDKQKNKYVGEVWSTVEKNLRKWMVEKRGSVKGLSLGDAYNNPVFNIVKTSNERHLMCSDFIFLLATEVCFLPIVVMIKKYSFEHVIASVCLYYMVNNDAKEASRALYWLDRKQISEHRKGKKKGGVASHEVDERAKEFARDIAEKTWREEREDNDLYTTKTDMIKYISLMLLADKFEGRSCNKKGYTAVVIWKWVKDLAPSDVTKPGRRSDKK